MLTHQNKGSPDSSHLKETTSTILKDTAELQGAPARREKAGYIKNPYRYRQVIGRFARNRIGSLAILAWSVRIQGIILSAGGRQSKNHGVSNGIKRESR